jgi:serine protease Do
MRIRRQQRLALAAIMAFFMGLSGYELGRASQSDPSPPAAPPVARTPRDSFAPAVATASPAVVHVKVTSVMPSAMRGFGGPDAVRQGTGSGFIIQADGIVLTNNHVVENAREITVTLSDGRQLPAQVRGRDPKTDLAVLSVDAPEPLPVVQLGDSDALSVGDWVIAIGNPFGLANTVTAGIVSAKGRAIGAGPYDEFIQTDAPINPGNSGGPLLDKDGRLIGVNTSIATPSGGNVGIGFAIPVDTVNAVVTELIKRGKLLRPDVGVKLVDQWRVRRAGFPRGVMIGEVAEGGPADAAGLVGLRKHLRTGETLPGDLVLKINGDEVKTNLDFARTVLKSKPGDKLKFTIERGGETSVVEVTVRGI